MNEKNTDKLFKEFPSFWRNSNDLSKSLMGFGFECGDGWFKLIYKLCKDIQKVVDKEKIEDFVVVQVKEKFGGLRFYHYGANEDVEKLVDKAEKDSFKICETCGKPGKTKCLNGWYATVCDTHHKKWKTGKEK